MSRLEANVRWQRIERSCAGKAYSALQAGQCLLLVEAVNDLERKPLILLIDDLVDNMRIRAKMLEHMGCEVLMATDYASAMGVFSNNDVDLLVIDYYLANNRTGEEIARAVRKLNAAVPMIMLTGAVSLPESAKHCVNEIIIKGSSGPTALMDAIKRLLPNAAFKPRTRR